MKPLSAKRPEWLECLYGDDPNSIGYQVYVLLDDFESWWTINEARRYAPRDPNGAVEGFGLLHGLLNRCFATSQMVAVRRFCDRYPIDDKKRGVWSLRSLLVDLTEHAPLLTRQAIFAAEGLRDDLQELEREAERAVRDFTADPLAELATSRRRHRDLDLLSGKTETNRSAQDHIRPQVFEALRVRLEATCKEICDKVDKFLAHAGTPQSRKALITDSSEVTPSDLRVAAIEIKDIFDFVSNIVLPRPARHGNSVPLGCMTICVPEAFDRLEHIEQPLVVPEDIPSVRRAQEQMRARLSVRRKPEEMLTSLGLL